MIRKIERSDFKYKKELSFDPDDVNVRLQHFRVRELIQLIDRKALEDLDDNSIYLKEEDNNYGFYSENEELDIRSEDDLQRMPDLWNDIQKSRFIESLMINLPIPIFYLDGSAQPWRVIDGLQRLGSILGFIQNEYKLVSLEYLVKECEGKKFNDNDFPGYLKARILDSKIIAYIISPGTPEDVKYNIFQRINTGGLKLNGQEIRNAIFRGIPANLLKELASYNIFKKVTNNKVTSRRMIDREYVNRFIAFQVFNYEDYSGKMDLFLSEALYDLYNRTNEELHQLERIFEISMHRAYEIFGFYAFYRPKSENEWGRQPNKAVFDMISWNLSQLSDDEFDRIEHDKANFVEKYFKLMNDNQILFKSINDTTGSKNAVLARFSILNTFINTFLI